MRTIGKQQARQFVLLKLDPVDVCGRNAELTLQSRVRGFERFMLQELGKRFPELADLEHRPWPISVKTGRSPAQDFYHLSADEALMEDVLSGRADRLHRGPEERRPQGQRTLVGARDPGDPKIADGAWAHVQTLCGFQRLRTA